MIDVLRYLGLPVGISSVSGRIDEIIVIVHYLMLLLFIGWVQPKKAVQEKQYPN